MRILKFSAKCSDMFGANLIDGNKLVGNYSGYVPAFFPGNHYGDYVQLEIDIDTGKIVNWKTPTNTQLKDAFENETDVE